MLQTLQSLRISKNVRTKDPVSYIRAPKPNIQLEQVRYRPSINSLETLARPLLKTSLLGTDPRREGADFLIQF